MCLPSVEFQSRPPLTRVTRSAASILLATALATILLQAISLHVGAEPIDIAEEAIASRPRLATRIAAVHGPTLRLNLIKSADNDRLAHWYAGEVWVEGQWLNLAEVEQYFEQEVSLSAYRNLRQQATSNLPDNERLARWCDKHNQPELAKMHWLYVLQFDPTHRAALNELNLTWHQGILLTQDEAQQYQLRERELLKEKKFWRVKAKRWRRDLEHGELERMQAARQEMREVHEAAAVPALLEQFTEPAATERVTLERRRQLISVLGGIDSPDSVDTLVQLAVESNDDSVRYAAIDQLKSKPLETYVPALLAELNMPVDASVSINQIGHNIVNHYTYSQETPYGEQLRDYRTSLTVPGQRYLSANVYRHRTVRESVVIPGRHRAAYECNGHLVPEVNTPERTVVRNYRRSDYLRTIYRDHPAYQANRQNTVRRSQTQAGAVGNDLAQRNAAIAVQNKHLAEILVEVTGETLNAYPKSWWNWWSDYLDSHPAVATVGTRQQLNAALLNQEPRGLARGTWIWTRRGKQPVEDVLPGDFVLSQHPQSGELAYQIVMAVGKPQQLKVSKVTIDDNDFHCTPGHVVWTTGSGWQRVSQLVAGQTLHGATSEVRVGHVAPAFDIDSYDLIVDGFHTLFVGELGLLVHDATPIGPIHVALPGFSPAAVADAAQLAAHGP